MTLKDFLKLHKNGCTKVFVSVYCFECSAIYAKVYFEREEQEKIIHSDMFKKISDRQVDHFCIVECGLKGMELCVYLRENQR